jgi:hypothetical protein
MKIMDEVLGGLMNIAGFLGLFLIIMLWLFVIGICVSCIVALIYAYTR